MRQVELRLRQLRVHLLRQRVHTSGKPAVRQVLGGRHRSVRPTVRPRHHQGVGEQGQYASGQGRVIRREPYVAQDELDQGLLHLGAEPLARAADDLADLVRRHGRDDERPADRFRESGDLGQSGERVRPHGHDHDDPLGEGPETGQRRNAELLQPVLDLVDDPELLVVMSGVHRDGQLAHGEEPRGPSPQDARLQALATREPRSEQRRLARARTPDDHHDRRG